MTLEEEMIKEYQEETVKGRTCLTALILIFGVTLVIILSLI